MNPTQYRYRQVVTPEEALAIIKIMDPDEKTLVSWVRAANPYSAWRTTPVDVGNTIRSAKKVHIGNTLAFGPSVIAECPGDDGCTRTTYYQIDPTRAEVLTNEDRRARAWKVWRDRLRPVLAKHADIPTVGYMEEMDRLLDPGDP